MSDLVGTCPKDFWEEWIAEGDAAGSPPTGTEWAWFTRCVSQPKIVPGERFYVVAHGKLRGCALVTRVVNTGYCAWAVVRGGGAVAVTIPESIPGFRGLRKRWWKIADEVLFPGWRNL